MKVVRPPPKSITSFEYFECAKESRSFLSHWYFAMAMAKFKPRCSRIQPPIYSGNIYIQS